MKRLLKNFLIMTTVLSVGMLSACGSQSDSDETTLDGSIVDYSDNTASASDAVGSTDSGEVEVPSDATEIEGTSSDSSSDDGSSSNSSSSDSSSSDSSSSGSSSNDSTSSGSSSSDSSSSDSSSSGSSSSDSSSSDSSSSDSSTSSSSSSSDSSSSGSSSSDSSSSDSTSSDSSSSGSSSSDSTSSDSSSSGSSSSSNSSSSGSSSSSDSSSSGSSSSDSSSSGNSSSDSTSSGSSSSGSSSSNSASGDYEITQSGNYSISTAYSGKITISCEGVVLYLNNASVTNKKKVIESDYDLTITLIGENSITNTNADGSNAIDVTGELTINGSGSLSITSTKNGISADSIKISAATLNITCENDGLHAEISAYDEDTVTSQPALSYDDGGYVYIENANITINSVADGIQADTFVYISGDNTVIDITTNGGSPSMVNEQSSDSGSGKGIKVGPADWGAKDANGDRTDFTDGDYQIIIEGGAININANDDAIHTDGGITISGGDITITSGDDGIHGDEYIDMTDGSVTISKCYEGVEAANIQIQGGKICVIAVDDGINAADGTYNDVGFANNNCQIIIDGGYVYVDADGDGVDSNGDIIINDGSLYISGQASGENTALDADGNIYINGGYVFAVGASGMVETPSANSTQNIVSFTHSSLSADTYLSLTDENGNEIISFTIPKACQSIIISCPELTKGSTYCIYGGSTCLTTFTISSTITNVNSSASVTDPWGNSGGNQDGFNGGMGGGIFGGWGGR